MISFKKHQSLLLAIILPPISLAIVLGIDHLKFGAGLEFSTVDLRFQIRAKTDAKAHEDVLLVGIDEQGLEQFGQWPWPRTIHGQFMNFLTLCPPKSMGWDLIFSEAGRDEGEDQAFADGLILHPGAILGAAYEDLSGFGKPDENDGTSGAMIGNTPALTKVSGDVGRLLGHEWALKPVGVLGESSMTGFVNVEPSKVDGIRRKAPLVVRVGKPGKEKVYPSLVLQMLMRAEEIGPDEVEVVLGERVTIRGKERTFQVPIDDQGQMWINYRGTNDADGNNIFEGKSEISYFGLVYFLQNYAQALQADPKAEWPKEYETGDGVKVPLPPVKNQILLVGQTAQGLTDFGPTPMGSQTALVKVHATILNNILKGDYLRQLPLLPAAISWLVLAWATVVPLRNSPVWVAIAVPIALVAAFLGIGFFFFHTASLHIPFVWPVLGFVIVHGSMVSNRLITESKAKGRIKAMFSTYVAPEVVDQLIASGEEPKLGGEETVITAFFSDIQSFSAFSEILTPERLVSLMNEYLTEMSHILKYKGNGTVDKFIGDAIVGIFGAPYHFQDHAYRACLTAIQIQKRQAELREHWEKQGDWPKIVHEMQTRIGLNTGRAVVGNMGSSDRMNYTMMGDTVNLAARCESGAKSYGVFTMISEDTKTSAEQHGNDIRYRYLDRIIVKGRTTPIGMYEIVDKETDLSDATRECLALFDEAMMKYLAKDWEGAIALFAKAEELEPFRPGQPGVGNNPSLVLMKRCHEMKANPPEGDWDGVYVMKSK
jgi:adenylate cyclase